MFSLSYLLVVLRGPDWAIHVGVSLSFVFLCGFPRTFFLCLAACSSGCLPVSSYLLKASMKLLPGVKNAAGVPDRAEFSCT